MHRALIVAALLLPAGAAHAATITYQFEGTISFVDAALSASFSNGQAASASFQIDSTTPDTGFGDDFGNYGGVANLEATLGGYQGSAAGGTSAQALLVLDHPAGSGGFDELEMSIQPFSGPALGMLELLRFQLDMEDPGGDAFSSDALPTSVDADAFSAKSFGLLFTDGVGFFGVFATIESVTVTVPEPAAALLLALAAGLLATRRRA